MRYRTDIERTKIRCEGLVDVGGKAVWVTIVPSISLSGRINRLTANLLGIPVYLNEPASPNPGWLGRLSIGTSAHPVQRVQHLPPIPELAKVHVFPVELG